MSSCRQFISDVTNELKAKNINDWISPRFILSEARDITAKLIKQDHDARLKLQKLSEGWSEIPCLSLVEVPIISCSEIDVRLCDKLMKSTVKLPDTFSFSNGDVIKYCASPNLSGFIDLTTPRNWNNIQKRKFRDKSKYYFFFLGGYFYIPFPKDEVQIIEEVRIEAYFKDQYDVYLFNLNSGNCQDCKDTCPKPLDFEFVCPFYLYDAVKQILLQRLGGIYEKIQESSNPDMDVSTKNNQRVLNNDKSGLIN